MTLKEVAVGGTTNQKYCQVSWANCKETLLLELAESMTTGISHTIPVQPMSHSHAEGDSFREAVLQRPCTQLPVHGVPCRNCRSSQMIQTGGTRALRKDARAVLKNTCDIGDSAKPPVITIAKEDPDMSCRSKVTTQTWVPLEGCRMSTRSFVLTRSDTWCTVP